MTSARVKGDNPFHDVYFARRRASRTRERTAEQWRASRPADAAAMDKIAGQPVALLDGQLEPEHRAGRRDARLAPTRAGGLPVMILYNLPYRDCGLYSAGGAGSAARYHKWIDGVARGIGVAPRGVRAGARRPAADVRLPERRRSARNGSR